MRLSLFSRVYGCIYKKEEQYEKREYNFLYLYCFACFGKERWLCLTMAKELEASAGYFHN